jgi:hypothetical protein
MRKYFLILGLLFVVSCKRAESEPFGLSFYFENPQPINDSELSKIPNKFRGIFLNSDSIYVSIKEKIILREYYNRFRFHKSELDSIKDGFDLVGSQYISKLDKEVYDYKYVGDSVEFSNKQIDTFFVFSNTQKAKRIDGQIVLNYKDSIYWKINAISLEKNILKIKCIYSEEDLKKMDSLTKIKSAIIDSSSFIISPSRSEFKQILNLKNLGDEQEYRRVIK